MDIVYASLRRRTRAPDDPASEVSEALSTLWAHATCEDGLEHASGRSEQDRVDFLMYLLTHDCGALGFCSAVHRASSLLRRCHAASALMQRRYLPPEAPTDVLRVEGGCFCAARTPQN
ncbi:hypothetical protein G3I77_38850 [Streptomyces sp. D2-8]|uniref:hypothetical protein n=1 Tax=Streptomyces sp. D2-8 TaxID=2707767 RepID=UPI0020C15E5A|nr:hypothetical protein [Streptomyces sp. D2-8]MCK8438734.1 hypothetical protein [Streptomyces sp. D2-8]